MKRLVVVIAVLCAALSGWTPALSAVLHAGHDMTRHGAQAEHHVRQGATVHDHGDAQTGDHGEAATHPVLCAACFSLPAAAQGATNEAFSASVYAPATCRTLCGTVPAPSDPPPKA